MNSEVVIVDYGMGNLYSVSRAFEYFGVKAEISRSPEKFMKADRLVLPGVGSFARAMDKLNGYGLIEPIKEYAETGKPFLGICLGMQLMCTESEEFGHHSGFNLIPGKVVKIPLTGSDHKHHKIPHMGWNGLKPASSMTAWKNEPLLQDIAIDSPVYFVHSYTAVPDDKDHLIASCEYHGCNLAAIIRSRNVVGCQFHPEKSGPIGLTIVHNFLKKTSQYLPLEGTKAARKIPG